MSLFKWIEKNPLQAAALGAGAFYGAPLLMGAMAPAAAAAAPAAAAGTAAGTTAAGAAGAAGAGGASTGLLGTIGGYAQPIGQALGAANAAKGLLAEAPMQPAQMPQANGQGAQTLAQLYQQDAKMSPEDQERLNRRTMWG